MDKSEVKPRGGHASHFNEALKAFKSSFAAVDAEGETPVWAFQKPNRNSKWDEKKMHKLIDSAPAGKKR